EMMTTYLECQYRTTNRNPQRSSLDVEIDCRCLDQHLIMLPINSVDIKSRHRKEKIEFGAYIPRPFN
ncbi:hypothetical protein DFH28DRAFT_889058, partial [Melampsora americana]